MVNTGDNIAHLEAVAPLVEGFGRLLDVPGVFVFGSNDYFAPTMRNPLWYLLPDDGQPQHPHPEAAVAGPARRLRAARLDRPDQHPRAGSPSATRRSPSSASTTRTCPTTTSTPSPGPAPADADVRIGVAHAPYLRVLDQYARDGYDLTFAGHTHGGQVCLPVKGAIVTNCDLEPARAKGLHRHPADSRPGDPGSSWLHVSAGAGTSPYAPIRLCCRPEATLLTLLPEGLLRPSGHGRKPGSEHPIRSSRLATLRAVAQLGSAPRSGRGGRRFKSCQPDRRMSEDITDCRIRCVRLRQSAFQHLFGLPC